MISAERLRHFLRKRMRARRLGVPLGRSANFRLPAQVRINGVRRPLTLPNQRGIRVAFMELLLADCYGLEKVPRPVETVLDIGANVGLFCVAARNAFPHATIHAYEPNSGLEPYLKAQAEATDCRYFLEAVDVEDGTVALDFDADDSVNTRSKLDVSGRIPAVAFRKTIERLGGRVDLAKVDCEGAEWDLWRDREAWQQVRSLSLEYHLWPAHTHEEVQQVVAGLGFTVQEQAPTSDFGLILATRSGR